MKKNVIIVAGGRGSRMRTDIPKQFLLIAGRPILMHTIETFHQYDSDIHITVVLPDDQLEYWQDQVEEYSFEIQHTITTGGSSRYESVRNGLKTVSEGLVAVHDGARPLVNQQIIQDSFELAAKHGNAIASTKLKDSIRHISESTNQSVDRNSYRIIQTPQTFQVELIKGAFEQTNDSPFFTDDASVLEHVGHKIVLSEGSFENIKITSPEDLIIAEAIIRSRQ